MSIKVEGCQKADLVNSLKLAQGVSPCLDLFLYLNILILHMMDSIGEDDKIFQA